MQKRNKFMYYITHKADKNNFLSLIYRSSRPEVILRKGVLKICSKFIGEHTWRSVIAPNLFCNFIEITLRHGHSPVNLLHIFRTPFPNNTFGRPLLYLHYLN